MKTFISGKIHRICVTEAELEYIGSVTIDAEIMAEANIEPYERVDVANVTNGERFTTYALPGKKGVFALNGGAARLGRPGDICIVMAYQLAESFPGAPALIIGENNEIIERLHYPLTELRPIDGPGIDVTVQ